MAKPRKTPTAEQKAWMKEAGYTEAQLDAFWQDNIDTNPIIKNLNSHGLTWRDMNLSCVKQLPTQKERDAEALAEKAQQEELERKAQEEKQRSEQYYKDHFDELMFYKIETGEKLTEKELSELVWGYSIETSYGDNNRWTRSVTSIVQLGDKYFSIDWEEGLTEYQDNEFFAQPVEVVKKTYEKTITVTEWVKS